MGVDELYAKGTITMGNQVDKLLSELIDLWSDWETHEHYYLVDILYPHGLIRSDYDDVMRVVSEAG